MHRRTLLLAALLVAPALAGCLGPPGADDGGGPGDDGDAGDGGEPAVDPVCAEDGTTSTPSQEGGGTLQATFNTSKGEIVVELFQQRAPITVANFVEYVASGFFNGTIVHRVIPGFVIQGGGFGPNLTKLETRDPIPLERHPELENARGTLSMARTQRPNSGTSQFFVNLADNTDTLGQGRGYAVFGEVVDGMDVVDTIANVSTHQEDGRKNVPEEDVVVHGATLDLPDGDGPPPVRVAPLRDEVHPPTDVRAQVPFQVVNDWDATRQVTVEPAGNATSVTVPHADGDGTLTLTPGASALAVARVSAGTAAEAGVAAAVDGESVDQATTDVQPTEGVGPAADEDTNTRVSVCYTGLFETGVPFDSRDPALDEQPGLRILPKHGQPANPLKIWTGEGTDPEGNSTKVIPGFKDAVVGFRQGQTNLAKVPSEEGYQDGVTRWFWVGVERVEST